MTLLSGAITLQGSNNPILQTDMKGNLNPVAIEPSRQFKKKKPTSLEKQLQLAKIRKLNADTAKEIQETQTSILSSYGPKSTSKCF